MLRHLDIAMIKFIAERHYSGDRILLPYRTDTFEEYKKEHDRLYRKYMTELGYASLLDEIERRFRYGKGLL